MPLKGRDDDDNAGWKPTSQPAPQSRDISKQIEKAQRERPNPSR